MKADAVPRLQLFNCTHAECGATFTREWRLKEHESAHTGARPQLCPVPGCGRRFTRTSHLRRHSLQHTGVKQFKCTGAGCAKTFFNSDHLKKHIRYAHGDKDRYFKCTFPNCTETFKKRRLLKHHQQSHGLSSFRCSKEGCQMTFDTRSALKAHEQTHTGYTCPKPGCQAVEYTWGKMRRHMAQHPASFSCAACKKTIGKRDALRRHKRTHALQKPVLLCPSQGCQAYFSTTFNLQHHIRKVHLQLLRHACSFPGCTRSFAMRESLARHLVHHDPEACKVKCKRRRSNKSWQKRLEGRNQQPLVEEDLRNLFSLCMRVSRRAKLEANLSGLFNERKIPHHVDAEVNLRDLFAIKPPQSPLEPKA
ncbi:P43 5S RNA-binding protein-like isoform X2 [Denticeps clupeoides]|uniref:P43 5S RNA-binding protein-like isoform X2 n=1 Tax=Denticeps clupeoides TaxID=299321 RepID=UPI0010A4B21F|nr:P43 5S RNA-binding protein-like isoform X2 [Denticeps clupeoides]